jgi:hypothetical protein
MEYAMAEGKPHRVLVVSDRTTATPELLAAIRQRAASGDAQFRILIPNPAHAEMQLRHPGRHEKAAEAELLLREAQPFFEEAAGGPVIGSISIRHNPHDAVEELMLCEPVDEIIVSVVPPGHRRWLHPDLAHRLAHFGVPVTKVEHPA